MPISNTAPLYVTEPLPHAELFAGVAVIGFAVTLLFVARGQTYSFHRKLSQVLLALWVLGPPLWFFYEFFYYFPTYGNMAEGAGYEKLKGAQDVTAKLWAAVP